MVPAVLVLTMVAPARADEAGDAFARLRASDDLLARGRLGQAYSGYLDLARRYPTWWAPVLKAGIAARALRLAPEISMTAVDRAVSVASGEPFVAFVRALTALETSGGRAGAGLEPGTEPDLAPTDLAVRLAMARGKRLEQRGDRDAALREYRWIANRCSRCVAAVWRLAVLGGSNECEGPMSLFPPRRRPAGAGGRAEPRRRAGAGGPGRSRGPDGVRARRDRRGLIVERRVVFLLTWSGRTRTIPWFGRPDAPGDGWFRRGPDFGRTQCSSG